MRRLWVSIALAALVLGLGAAVSTAASSGPELGLLRIDGRKGIGLAVIGADGRSTMTLIPPGSRDLPTPLFVSPLAWSPDGETLVFSGGRPGGRESAEPSAVHLYAAQGDGGRPALLPGTSGGFDPLVLPDGGTVVFLRARGRNSASATDGHVTRETRASFSLWRIGIDGSSPTRITPWRTRGILAPVSASPDGETIVAVRDIVDRTTSKAVRRVETVLIDLGGKVRARIGKDVSAATFSPDGTRLALVRLHRYPHPHVRKEGDGSTTTFGQTDLFVEDLATGSVRRLTHGPASDLLPSWDPSGERLAFVRESDSGGEAQAFFGLGDAVFEINADGSCPTRILHEPGVGFLSPAWRPGPERGAGALTC